MKSVCLIYMHADKTEDALAFGLSARILNTSANTHNCLDMAFVPILPRRFQKYTTSGRMYFVSGIGSPRLFTNCNRPSRA
jgi:hypothetical protein